MPNILNNCTTKYGPCIACTRRENLRKEIEDTRKILEALVLEEREMARKVNECHDPFNRVPVEIVSDIFNLSLEPFRLQLRPSTPTESLTQSYDNALKLGAVCSSWRTVAWRMPRLWTTFMMCLSNTPTQNQIEVTREWLLRSKVLPLSIRLNFGMDTIYGADNFTLFLDLVEVFHAHSKRWESLSLKGSSFLLEHFTANCNDGAPILNTLEISCHDLDDSSSLFTPAARRPMPKKVVIDAFLLKPARISWSNVTSVKLHDTTVLDCVFLLQAAPKLVDCALIGLRELEENEPFVIPANPAVHHGLRSLMIESADIIIDHVTLPALENLYIGGEGDPLDSESIIGFVKRSSCRLTSLQIQGLVCPEVETIRLLVALPSSLTIFCFLPNEDTDEEIIDPDLLFMYLNDAFPPTSDTLSRPILFPNLEVFYYGISNQDEIPLNPMELLRCGGAEKKRPIWMLKFIRRIGLVEDIHVDSYPGSSPSRATVLNLFDLERTWDFDSYITPEEHNNLFDYVL